MLMTYVLLLPVLVGFRVCRTYVQSLVLKIMLNITLSSRYVWSSNVQIYMNVNKLAYAKEAKYFGVIICNDLKDDGDILRHLRNFYARSSTIIRKFHHCSVGVKLRLFHAHCCTTYCCQSWVDFNKCSYLKAKVAYNNINGYWDIADGTARIACLLIMLLIHLTPYCVRTFTV